MEKANGESFISVLRGVGWSVFCPDPISPLSGTSFCYRAKTCLRDDYPRIRDASRTSVFRILNWARRGSPLRSFLVISVGAITSLILTGFVIFLLFFLAATLNAIVISLLVSLAAVGGFLALFFGCVTAIYIGGLSFAIFVISVATISAVVSIIVITGWIGLLWATWLALTKSASIAKISLNMSKSAVSATAGLSRQHNHGHRN